MSLDPNRLQAATPIVLAKARKLSRKRGFNRSDEEDIRQDLWTHLIRQSPKFQPTITTWEKFVSYILDKYCISLLRHRRAEKRSPDREACSLNDPVLDGDGRVVDRHQTTPEASNVPQRLRELQRDVADVLARLSDLDRVIALGLVTGTINSVASELGIPRSAVERHIAELLRDVCEHAGLRDYL